MKTLILLATAVLALASALTASGFEGWHNKVTFEAPSNWKMLKSGATDKAVTKLYLLRKDKIGLKIHPSNALLQYYPVPSSVTISDADGIVASHTKDATLILRAQDGVNWRTYLLTYRERQQQYIVLDRIGIADGVGAELMISFPLIPGTKSDPMVMLTLNGEYVQDEKMAGIYFSGSAVTELVHSFNSACMTLKVAGKGEYRATAVTIPPPSDVSEVYRYKGNAASEK
jgi:hypothetical protein